jgi:hypothetical protein
MRTFGSLRATGCVQGVVCRQLMLSLLVFNPTEFLYIAAPLIVPHDSTKPRYGVLVQI